MGKFLKRDAWVVSKMETQMLLGFVLFFFFFSLFNIEVVLFDQNVLLEMPDTRTDQAIKPWMQISTVSTTFVLKRNDYYAQK